MERLVPGFVLASRYQLASRVAAGGMGEVWKATDRVLLRDVALKVMHPRTVQEQALADRFRAEARFAAQLSHPNIVEVFDFGEHDGLAFLVMEYIDGPTLAELVDQHGPLDPGLVRRILRQLSGALARAHAGGIIHRDVKPANVIVSPDGFAKLMDFGIAKHVDAPSLTTTGEILGTTFYISPEQALGEEVTARSDLYALGVLGHELLTGRRPFDRGTPIATAIAHLEDPPPPLPAHVPPDLAAVIEACLAKRPEDRPADATAVASALAPTGDTVVLPRVEPPTAAGPRRAISRNGTVGRRPAGDLLPPTQRWWPVSRAGRRVATP